MSRLLGVEQIFWAIVNQLGLVGVFLVSFIGAASVLFPIPYTPIILLLGVTTTLNPYLLIIAAGTGSAVGELVGYSIGYAAESIVGEKNKRKFNSMLKILMRHKTVWPVIIFIFALTPLPDDLLFIPLGLVRFNFIQVLLPCLAGKFLLFYLLIFGGRYVYDWMGSYLGREGFATSLLFTTVTVVILVVTIIGIWKVDWEKVAERYEKFANNSFGKKSSHT